MRLWAHWLCCTEDLIISLFVLPTLLLHTVQLANAMLSCCEQYPCLFPDYTRVPAETVPLSDPVSATRVLCGAVILPTIATMVGKVIFGNVSSNFQRTLLVSIDPWFNPYPDNKMSSSKYHVCYDFQGASKLVKILSDCQIGWIWMRHWGTPYLIQFQAICIYGTTVTHSRLRG